MKYLKCRNGRCHLISAGWSAHHLYVPVFSPVALIWAICPRVTTPDQQDGCQQGQEPGLPGSSQSHHGRQWRGRQVSPDASVHVRRGKRCQHTFPKCCAAVCSCVRFSCVLCPPPHLSMEVSNSFRERQSQQKIPVAGAMVVLAVVETEGVSLCTVLPVLPGLSL